MEATLYPMEGKKRRFCEAKTRSGAPCKNRPMENGRCRFHGGMSLSGPLHGRYKHGRYTKAAIAQRKWLSMLLRESKALLQQIQR